MKRYFWIALGWTCVGAGILGIVLPLVPTTPFLLLAAFAFSRGSERLHTWLIEHPTFGPPIVHWQHHKAVARKTKVVATVSILLIFSISLLVDVPKWALIAQGMVLCLVLIFLWVQKEPQQ